MTIIYDLIYLLAVSLGWPYLLYRRLTRGPSHTSLRERLGGVPSRPVAGSCIWIHGVSLGEINAARTIVAEIKARAPQTVVVISSTTRTGLDRARTLYADHIVFRFPLDFSFAIRNVLKRIRPSAIILMELEVWPNLIEVAVARGIPVMIANGRLTESKSMKRFGLPVVRGPARR
ncbi:MAG: 3-deoxy-D-manno-octulosonic acid transferase, partial [Planctomycetes bacterium]|nr:3-deoxy-D-manno-octulosonic acid transferase [Planctomycetota bacterium]